MYRANIGTCANYETKSNGRYKTYQNKRITITRCPMNGLQSFRWQYVTNPSCWYTATAK